MGIKHKFVSAKPDNADSTLVSSSEWNDEHNHVPFNYRLSESTTNVNMSAALTELTIRMRQKIDLTYATQIRLTGQVVVAGAVGSNLFIQYSTNGTTWNTLNANIFSLNPTGTVTTVWENIPVGAKGDVFIRVVGQGGDATADPQWSLSLQVR